MRLFMSHRISAVLPVGLRILNTFSTIVRNMTCLLAVFYSTSHYYSINPLDCISSSQQRYIPLNERNNTSWYRIWL